MSLAGEAESEDATKGGDMQPPIRIEVAFGNSAGDAVVTSRHGLGLKIRKRRRGDVVVNTHLNQQISMTATLGRPRNVCHRRSG